MNADNMRERVIVETTDCDGNHRRFSLGEPLPVSREVRFQPETKASNAFYLPMIYSKTVEFEGQFIGDVERGGSCNVDTLCFTPHNITHLETSAHILAPSSKPAYVSDINPAHLEGIVLLIDLSKNNSLDGSGVPGDKAGSLVAVDMIAHKLRKNKLPISMLALKTRSSLLAEDYDFSGKNFLAVSPEAARLVHDYTMTIPQGENESTDLRIHCLLLDLPSIDPESDGGKLSAHRNFFGLPATGIEGEDLEKRALVELAYFNNLEEGYYYARITPPRIRTNAVTTGIIFRPLLER